MRKAVTDIEIVYEQVDTPPEESQRILNEVFDILFEEALKYLKEKKMKEKMKRNQVSSQKSLENIENLKNQHYSRV